MATPKNNRSKHRKQPDQTTTRYSPPYTQGLSQEQVAQRVKEGLHNEAPPSLTPPGWLIVFRNVFTLFNLLNVAIAALLVWGGHLRNILFLGVAISNTLIGIYQELKSKKILDALSIVARTKATVVRDGNKTQVDQENVVLDDVLFLASGDQICADGQVLCTEGMEIDEALLTGESDHIQKPVDSQVMSGSFITAGEGYIRVTAVGSDGYAAKISNEAKQEKKPKSEIMRTLNLIIRVLTLVIIPVGLLLYYAQSQQGISFDNAILGVSGAVLGMIPEGLMLLTGVTLAVAARNLAKHKTLVQSLPSIETLARVDVLCLDKTGTITDGSLKAIGNLPLNGFTRDQVYQVTTELMAALKDSNPTAMALRSQSSHLPVWNPQQIVPFSSKRKWSGVTFEEQGSYLIGAPGFIFSEIPAEINQSIEENAKLGYRVLCLAYSPNPLVETQLPSQLAWSALLFFSDTIRKEAPDTFRYFAAEKVAIKVISGDDALTVSTIAGRAGLANSDRYVDMSTLAEDADFSTLVEETTVFGRVSPYQKRELIRALQKNGHTTCMTGDGVNDVLALKEADCGVAMVGGSDAARNVADFVLLTSNFGAMVEVLKEGRRVINNIEQVAALYLVKTIYSIILAVIYMAMPYPYPLTPLRLSPVNGFTVGIPSFFLALRPNYRRPKGRFVANVLEHSLPAALTVVFNIMIIQLAAVLFSLTLTEVSTMSVFLTGVVGFVLLIKITQPPTLQSTLLFCSLGIAFLCTFLLFRDFFMYAPLWSRNLFFYLPLALGSPRLFLRLHQGIRWLEAYLQRLKRRLRQRWKQS